MITYEKLTDKNRSLTNQEYLSLHGTLSLDRIEALVEMGEAIGEQEGALSYIDEARRCFPGEDFLQDTINNLQALSKSLLDEDKEDLLGIIEQVEELQTSIVRDIKYGLEQLKEAKEMIYEP